jgi:phosphoribosylaminoimidazolecarboxamide formyltransferase/IMP cyclohydrolase
LTLPQIDFIINLYPLTYRFPGRASEFDIIEKLNYYGGISLIRAAAKNFKDTVL